MALQNHCPACDHSFNAHTRLTGPPAEPRPGDIMVCIGCSAILVFNDDKRLRLAESADIAHLDDTSKAVLGKTRELLAGINGY